MTVEKLQNAGDRAIHESLRNVRKQRLGVLDASFLSQSVGILNTPPAVCIEEGATVRKAIEIMRERHIGCVLCVGADGKLSGIFSERDCMEKVVGVAGVDMSTALLADFMTREPVTIDFTVSMAYGLSLMSMGGFRHLPVVDDENHPVGVVSVKDIVNHITSTFVDDVMSFI